MKQFWKEKDGYTLVELMVVVVIIAILASAAVPAYSGYIKKAKASKYIAECRTVYTAVQAYLLEYHGSRASDGWSPEELEKEVELLTGKDVSVADSARAAGTGDYVIVMGGDSVGNYRCESVVCYIDNTAWVFDTEDGTFIEE